MFYEGDLQSGIAKAVQESKLVVCFVTGNVARVHGWICTCEANICADDGEESLIWENDFLQDDIVTYNMLRTLASSNT